MGNWVWRKSSFSEGTNNTSCVEVGQWRKSSFSEGGNNACVEVGFASRVTALRDSKNPDGGTLSLSPTAWDSFRSAITR